MTRRKRTPLLLAVEVTFNEEQMDEILAALEKVSEVLIK